MNHASGDSPPTRTIVVATDLGLAGANATWRAAHLARGRGAALRLVHTVRPAGDEEAARAALSELGACVQARLGVAVDVELTRGDLARETARAAGDAQLLVVPARGAHTLRERISGTDTERIVRASRIPVLVVRRPLARARDSAVHAPAPQDLYARVLVGVQLAAGASGVIASASSLSADPRLEVFHALRADRQPAQAAAQGTAVERARAALQAQIAVAGTLAASAVPTVGVGDAGASIVAKSRAIGAELVVLGRRESRLLGDLFLGAVAREVLAGSPSDVLLVPTAASAGGSPQAPRRKASDTHCASSARE
jgi:nucleotide-binding universal stress UspA family protein